MSGWKEALLGLAATASLLPYLKDDWSRSLASLFLLLSSVLYGGVLAALFFTGGGWLATVVAVAGAGGYYLLRRRLRPRSRRGELLSPLRQAQAEALMDQVRDGDGPRS